jgi:hypothetical protein
MVERPARYLQSDLPSQEADEYTGEALRRPLSASHWTA